MPLVSGEVKISSPVNYTMPTSSSPRRVQCISRPLKASATYGSTAAFSRPSQLRTTSLDRNSIRDENRTSYRTEFCSSRPICKYPNTSTDRHLLGLGTLENKHKERNSSLSHSAFLSSSSSATLRHLNFSTRKGISSLHDFSSGSPILMNYTAYNDNSLETKKINFRSNSSYGSLNSLPETSSLTESALSSPLKVSSLTSSTGISSYASFNKNEIDENSNRQRIRYDANHNIVPKNVNVDSDKSKPLSHSYVPRHLNSLQSSSSSSVNSTNDVSDYTVYRPWRGSLLAGTTSGYSSSENASTSSSRRMSKDNLSKGGLVGLKNLGNTCFMNSVLQCLSNTKPLLEYCLRETYLSDINDTISSMKGALFKAFANLMQSLWKGNGETAVNPQPFKNQIQKFAPRFMGYSQQDAQEFLRYLLQGLHEDVNRVSSKPNPITSEIEDTLSESQKASESWKRYLRIDDSKIVGVFNVFDIFVGQLKSTLYCTTCSHNSVTFDPFWDLSLPIPKMSGQVKLHQCFDLFTREEILDGDEKPTCSKCKTRRKCTKSMTIHKFPKILVLHLKRFSPTERYKTKLSTYVDLPITSLDLSSYASNANRSQSCVYNLYAVSNHSGTIYSGHYTAYCKHPYSGEWHDFNDSRVSLMSMSSLVTSEAYVLFYELANHSSHL